MKKNQEKPRISPNFTLMNAPKRQAAKHQRDHKKNAWALLIVKQTPKVCLEAVRHHSVALMLITNKTPELCLEAVKHHGTALEYVKEQTTELCLIAIKQDRRALQFVKDPTKEMEIVAYYGEKIYEATITLQRRWKEIYYASDKAMFNCKANFESRF